MGYIIEDEAAELLFWEQNQPEPTLYEINQERYWEEIRDNAREEEADDEYYASLELSPEQIAFNEAWKAEQEAKAAARAAVVEGDEIYF